jgi:hypothetical protein
MSHRRDGFVSSPSQNPAAHAETTMSPENSADDVRPEGKFAQIAKVETDLELAEREEEIENELLEANLEEYQ